MSSGRILVGIFAGMGTYSSKEITAEEQREGIPVRTGTENKSDEQSYPAYMMVRHPSHTSVESLL
jgi:hypothetical protein